MTINFEAIRTLMPVLRAATRYFRVQLAAQGVPVRLSPECLAEFVTNAADVVARTRRRNERYVECLHRNLRSRAQFVLSWTTTDERLGAELSELVKIARRFAIPRPSEPEAVTAKVGFDRAAGQ